MPIKTSWVNSDAPPSRSHKILGSFRKLARKNSGSSQISVTSVTPDRPSSLTSNAFYDRYSPPSDVGSYSSIHSSIPRNHASQHRPYPISEPRTRMSNFILEPPPAYSSSPSSFRGPTLDSSRASLSSTHRNPTSTLASSPIAAGGPSNWDAWSPTQLVPQEVESATRPSIEGDSPYAFLSTFDTTLLIDDSGSMAGQSWREVSQALMTIAPIVTTHDSDGIDIYFLNHKSSDRGNPSEGIAPGGYRGIKRASTVTEIFERVRPSGGTPTGMRVNAILKPYLARLEHEAAAVEEVKPLNLIVLTDGVPSDDVESVLITAAKKLDRLDAPSHQVGVQFFQVGNEAGAREALMELDDELGNLVEGGIRDIVDTVTWNDSSSGGAHSQGHPALTGEGILKVVLGAVVRRLDRKKFSNE